MKMFEQIIDIKTLAKELRVLNMAMSEPGNKSDILFEFAKAMTELKRNPPKDGNEKMLYDSAMMGLEGAMKLVGLDENVKKQVEKAINDQKGFDNKTAGAVGLKNGKDEKTAIAQVAAKEDAYGAIPKQKPTNYMR
jgi:hypothetical protein